MNSTVARFATAGIANTVIGVCAIALAHEVLGLDHRLANVVGYSVGLLSSFILNQQWVFRNQGSMLPALIRFALVFLMSYTGNFAVLVAMLRQAILPPYLAHLLGLGVYTALFYAGSRFFVFRNRAPEE